MVIWNLPDVEGAWMGKVLVGVRKRKDERRPFAGYTVLICQNKMEDDVFITSV